jgi:hypothetical protein
MLVRRRATGGTFVDRAAGGLIAQAPGFIAQAPEWTVLPGEFL